MKFEELPHAVQLIAAQTLADRIQFSSVGAAKQEIEPAVKLAREIRGAFTELYSRSESDQIQNGNDSKAG